MNTSRVRQAWICGLGLCAALLSQVVMAQPVQYEAGVHYLELAQPLPDLDPDRIEVVELFWYGCPECYDLLPASQIWESSYRTTDMDFSRAPLVWNKAMEAHARIYLTADVMGLLPVVPKSGWEVKRSIHNDAFEAIHEQGKALVEMDEIWALFEATGVTRDAFDLAWNSAEVTSRLDELKKLSTAPEIGSLPALLLHGRYVIRYNAAVKSQEDLYKVLNFLIARIRDAQRAQR